MPARSKGLTWTFNARLTAAEEAAVRGAVTEYRECGITISLNDALRVLVRRGARPLPRTLGPLKARIDEHIVECEWCSDARGCPEVRRMEHARRCLVAEESPMLPGAEDYAEKMGRVAPPSGARTGVLGAGASPFGVRPGAPGTRF
jgi:hypothetical protein